MTVKTFVCRLSQTGQLDSSFGNNGMSIHQIIPSFHEYAEAVEIDRDDRIVIASTGTGYNSAGSYSAHIIIFRYLADGSLDSDFGNGNGYKTETFASMLTYGEDLAIDGDGRIVIAGFAESNIVLIRLDQDGNRDNSFNSNGAVRYVVPDVNGAYPHGVAITSEQKIVVGGFARDPGEVFMVAQFNPDGSIDTSFGDNGVVLSKVSPAYAHERARALAIDGKDRIVLAGEGRFANEMSCILMARFEKDGSLDTTFGSDGYRVIEFDGAPQQFATAVTTLKNVVRKQERVRHRTTRPKGPWPLWPRGGSRHPAEPIWPKKPESFGYITVGKETRCPILVSGATTASPNGAYRFAMAKLTETGELDSDFGDDGLVVVDAFVSAWYHNVSRDMHRTDKGIVLAGRAEDGGRNVAVARYKHNGEPDSDFGTDGQTLVDLPYQYSPSRTATGVRFDKYGRIAVVGNKID